MKILNNLKLKKIVEGIIRENKNGNKFDVTSDSLKHQFLSEVQFSRFFTKYMDLGFIIISADRTCEAEKGRDCSEKEERKQFQTNRINEKEIRRDFKLAGFPFVPVLGGYREAVKDPETGEEMKDEEGNVVRVDKAQPEKGFVVLCAKGISDSNKGMGEEEIKNKFDKLKELGISLSKKFNQDSFLMKPPNFLDKKAYLVDKNGQIEYTFNSSTIGDLTQSFFTTLRKRQHPGKRFSMTEHFYLLDPPKNGAEAYSADRYGEIFFRFSDRLLETSNFLYEDIEEKKKLKEEIRGLGRKQYNEYLKNFSKRYKNEEERKKYLIFAKETINKKENKNKIGEKNGRKN